jgi:hypothetical protein
LSLHLSSSFAIDYNRYLGKSELSFTLDLLAEIAVFDAAPDKKFCSKPSIVLHPFARWLKGCVRQVFALFVPRMGPVSLPLFRQQPAARQWLSTHVTTQRHIRNEYNEGKGKGVP